MVQMLKRQLNAKVLPLRSHLRKVSSEKYSLQRKVICFALQLMRHDGELDLSDALIYAWDEMKKFGDLYKVIEFENTKGQLCKRVVMLAHWNKFYTPKGTGRPIGENRILFADAAKVHCGVQPIISTYKNRMK